VSRPRRRLAALVATGLAMLVMLVAGPARADNVDALIRDLKTGSDYKIRLSAALSLARLGDRRAIPAFVVALSDSDKTVRGASVVGLGKLVDGSTPASQRQEVIDALVKLTRREKSGSVKNQADKALKTIRAIDAAGPSGTGGVYVDLGPMAAKVQPSDRYKTLMRKTTERTFGKKASNFMLTWNGGPPSRKELDRRKTAGFHVDGTLTDVSVKESGASAMVSCKVSMLIATYPEKSIFGFLNGGASVTASRDAKDIELAKEDCLVAVVEDLVAKKIIPTIKIKAGP